MRENVITRELLPSTYHLARMMKYMNRFLSNEQKWGMRMEGCPLLCSPSTPPSHNMWVKRYREDSRYLTTSALHTFNTQISIQYIHSIDSAHSTKQHDQHTTTHSMGNRSNNNNTREECIYLKSVFAAFANVFCEFF